MAYTASDNKEEFVLIIPANVNARYEIIPGFGNKELVYLLISVMVGIFLLLGLGALKKTEYVKKEDLSVYQMAGLTEEELSKDIVALEKEIISPPIRLIAAITPPVLVYLLFKTDSISNISFYEQIQYKRHFDKKQKRYLYSRNINQ